MTIKITCPHCDFSKIVPREKVPAGVRWATCPRCHQRFELVISQPPMDLNQQEPARRVEEESERKASPWENRSEFGLWQGIYRTCKWVLFSPRTFFSHLTVKGGMGEPLTFGVLLGSLGTMFSFFWQFLIMSGSLLSSGDNPFGQAGASLIFLGILVISPLLVLTSLLCTSVICHLLLLMVKGGKNGFQATFRVISFTMATQILGLVPIIGGFAGLIWWCSVQVIGLKEIHETSYGRLFVAFLIPVGFLLILVAAGLWYLFVLR
ncbi:MAG: YIP1 family protein [Pseudomonadota bacterium]